MYKITIKFGCNDLIAQDRDNIVCLLSLLAYHTNTACSLLSFTRLSNNHVLKQGLNWFTCWLALNFIDFHFACTHFTPWNCSTAKTMVMAYSFSACLARPYTTLALSCSVPACLAQNNIPKFYMAM